MSTVRWNIAVSADTDQDLRIFLASQGHGRKGNLSRFIEEAVRERILDMTAQQAKEANAAVNEHDLDAMILEATQWAQNH